jgi:hypothetical protein
MCLLKYITIGKYCYAGGSQPIRNVARTVLEFGLQLYIRFFSLNNSCLSEYFNPIFIPRLEQKDTINTTSSASYIELHPEK